MKLSGSHRLAHPRPVVWEALMDPAVLSRTLPGCERLEPTGDGAFAGALTVAIGPVRGQFEGTLAMTDRVPPERYHMKLAGQGASGFLTGEGEVRLEEVDGGAATVVHYDLDAQVGGRIAGVGQRLLDSSAKVIARQGLEGLERQLAARGTAGAGITAAGKAAPSGAGHTPPDEGATAGGATSVPGTPATPASLPGQAAFAARFAQGLWQEMVPSSARPWLIGGLVLLVALVIWLIAR